MFLCLLEEVEEEEEESEAYFRLVSKPYKERWRRFTEVRTETKSTNKLKVIRWDLLCRQVAAGLVVLLCWVGVLSHEASSPGRSRWNWRVQVWFLISYTYDLRAKPMTGRKKEEIGDTTGDITPRLKSPSVLSLSDWNFCPLFFSQMFSCNTCR